MANKETKGLPKALSHYQDASFSLQMKARLIYYLCLASIISVLFVIIVAAYIQIMSPTGTLFNLPSFISEVFLLVLFFGCLTLLMKGWYVFSSNLLIVSTLVCVWLIIAVDSGETITRLDNIVYLFAILSMLPLAISNNRYIIPIYILLNIFCLYFFILFFDLRLNLSKLSTIDFLADGTIAFIFIGIVSYNIYRINKLSLEKAESDIKERILAEDAHAISEKKYREMTELLPQIVFETDLNGLLTYVNRNGYKLFGFKEDEFIKGVNIFSMIHASDHEKVKENIKKILGDEMNHGSEYRALRNDGSIFPIQIFSSPIKENQQIVGFRGIIIDITEKKLSEKELVESEEKYRTLMENMNETVMLVDHDDRVMFVNKKFTEKLGYLAEEIIGKIGYETLLDPKDHIIIKEANLDRIKNKSGQYEMTFIGKYGQKIDFLISGAPLFDSEGNTIGSIGTMTDITEKKIIEKELEKYRGNLEILVKERTEELDAANEELIATNDELYSQREELKTTITELHQAQNQLVESEKMASLGILSAGIAHEINNPLNFIVGGVFSIENYISENLGIHMKKIEPMIQVINVGVERVSKIVTSLNHFSRNNDSTNETCDLHQVIDNCLIMLQNQLKFKIEIVKKYADLTIKITGNEGKLHQAFLNVLSNAQQAISDLGTITITTKTENGYAVIEISDTGSGIKKENLSKIFNPFFTTKDPGKGTGLGLSITYKIIQEHNGKIEYISEIGKGTTASVKIPHTN